MLINQRWKYYEGSAKKFLKHVCRHINKLKKEGGENAGDREVKKINDTNVVINLAAYMADDQGFLFSAFRHSGYPSGDKILDKLVHSVRPSGKAEGVVLELIDSKNDFTTMVNPTKITELKVDFFSFDKDFIVKVISILLAKIRDEIEIQGKQ